MKETNQECCHGHKSHWIHIVTILVLVGILAYAFMGAPSREPIVISQSGELLNKKTINVTGTVEKNITPDEVDIALSVETLNASAQVSQQQNADTSTKVIAALKAQGIADKDIQTSGYSVYEDKQWNDKTGMYESLGYRTRNSVTVTLHDAQLSDAGKTIDAAITAGANNVSGITFTLSKAKQAQVKLDALKEAAQMAQAKATAIASGSGVTVGKVRTLTEQSYYFTPNYANYDTALAGSPSAKASTPISAADVTVNASVAVEYDIQ